MADLGAALEAHREGLSALVAKHCHTDGLKELQRTLEGMLRTISRSLSQVDDLYAHAVSSY